MKIKTISPRFFLLLLTALTFYSVVAQPRASSQYQKEVDDWHKQRLARLKTPNSWLNLEGLFWLKEGKNYFGSDSTNQLVSDNPLMPAVAGYFERNGNTVTWYSQPGITVLSNDQPVNSMLVFHPDSTNAPQLALGQFRWNIIRRDDQLGVRFRNLKHKAVEQFAGIERYPVDSAWKLTARLIPVASNQISVMNVLGQNTTQKMPGKLQFTIEGKTYMLDALDEGDDELFIIFGDATSGVDTYPSGRYMYVKKPGADGLIILDFNKAYNPPCAFTKFATCLLPPPQNILPIAITAGEKNYENAEGH